MLPSTFSFSSSPCSWRTSATSATPSSGRSVSTCRVTPSDYLIKSGCWTVKNKCKKKERIYVSQILSWISRVCFEPDINCFYLTERWLSWRWVVTPWNIYFGGGWNLQTLLMNFKSPEKLLTGFLFFCYQHPGHAFSKACTTMENNPKTDSHWHLYQPVLSSYQRCLWCRLDTKTR